MGTATLTRTADRVLRYRDHTSRTWTTLDVDAERADLARVVEMNTLEALEAGEAVEAQSWTALGNVRIALRARSWR